MRCILDIILVFFSVKNSERNLGKTLHRCLLHISDFLQFNTENLTFVEECSMFGSESDSGKRGKACAVF